MKLHFQKADALLAQGKQTLIRTVYIESINYYTVDCRNLLLAEFTLNQ